MNGQKMRAIVEFVRSQGELPTDQMGHVLSEDDLLVWYGLDKVLTREERLDVKEELQGMAEAQELVERLRSEMP